MTNASLNNLTHAIQQLNANVLENNKLQKENNKLLKQIADSIKDESTEGFNHE